VVELDLRTREPLPVPEVLGRSVARVVPQPDAVAELDEQLAAVALPQGPPVPSEPTDWRMWGIIAAALLVSPYLLRLVVRFLP
jgi:hypothetical protein